VTSKIGKRNKCVKRKKGIIIMKMPDYKQYGEAMYDQSTPKPLPKVSYSKHESDLDLQPSERNPLLLLGLGLAGGALIGAAILFIVMPNYNQMVEKKVEEPVITAQIVPQPVVIAPPPVQPKVEMVAPIVVTPPPPPPAVVIEAPKRPAITLPQAEITSLVTKAKQAIKEGDISLARALLQRAATANDGGALLMLGETYDPNMLKQWGVRGIKADAEKAKDFYFKAEFMGENEAKSRLRELR
jgi:hypothetical protein